MKAVSLVTEPETGQAVKCMISGNYDYASKGRSCSHGHGCNCDSDWRDIKGEGSNVRKSVSFLPLNRRTL